MEETKNISRRSIGEELARNGDWIVTDGELELARWKGDIDDVPICDHCGHFGSLVARISQSTGQKRRYLHGPEPEGTKLYNNEAETHVLRKWSELEQIDLADPNLTFICKSCLRG